MTGFVSEGRAILSPSHRIASLTIAIATLTIAIALVPDIFAEASRWAIAPAERGWGKSR